MTMSGRIVVMHEGVLQQVGTPAEVYGSPATLFVAGFVGAPPMNLLRGKAEQGGFAHPALATGLAGTPPGSGRDTLTIRADAEAPLAVGEALRWGVRAARLHLFDAASGARLDASLAPPAAVQA
jgi:ABC-type Fe3+/spermidine/putrescine transport system ATPase subunit